MKQPVERRLAAILAADVAGYSRLMGLDEAGTAQALREHRAAANPLIAQHGGRTSRSIIWGPRFVSAPAPGLATRSFI
jgi:class 3 adenylate cyclase